MLTWSRARGVLHVHDSHGRRRKASSCEEVPRCVPASAKGELHALASCTDSELQNCSSAISDREFLPDLVMGIGFD